MRALRSIAPFAVVVALARARRPLTLWIPTPGHRRRGVYLAGAG